MNDVYSGLIVHWMSVSASIAGKSSSVTMSWIAGWLTNACAQYPGIPFIFSSSAPSDVGSGPSAGTSTSPEIILLWLT